MKTKKRIISFLSAVCLITGLMTTTLFAAEGDAQNSAIVLGTGRISDQTEQTDSNGKYYTPNSYVYFGVNDSASIKWRVLDADKTNDGTTSGMFLLSEYLLADNVAFDAESGIWQGSDAQAWCVDFAADTDIFSQAEQDAMAEVTKSDAAETLYGVAWGASELKADKVFFLSAGELAGYVGDYDAAPGLIAKANEYGNPGQWWLRSPDANASYNAGTVNFEGIADVMIASLGWAARPAVNLDSDAVLFTSAAEGGKAGDGVFKVSDIETNEWKLTLLDNSRNFTVLGEDAATVAPGSTITMKYTGAVVYDAASAPNEYISAMITNDSGILYYGRIAQPASASGTAQVTIPEELAEGSYTLKVFSEQYNGGAADDTKLTDYASDFTEIALTVDADAGDADLGGEIHTHSGGTATCTSPATCSGCGETYGEKDAKNHTGGEELRGAKAATATEEGYTGDTYCKGCGVKIAEGTKIPATGSNDNADNNSGSDNNNNSGSDNNDNSGSDNTSAAGQDSKVDEAPKAGDNSMVGLWSALTAVCLIALITVFFVQKGKRAR